MGALLMTERGLNIMQQFLQFMSYNINEPDTQMTWHSDGHISAKQVVSTNALVDIRRRQRDSRIIKRHECHCQQWIRQCITGC